ncbi:MAG: MASE1 domain-containing protein [Nitrosomonadales bacterium]|nr:MASE1 domain-containing protein [Nitrosomonadales bacterium]
MPYSDTHRRLIHLLKQLGVAALYALLAKIVLTYFSANGVVSIVWPSSGLALAVLLIGGKRYFWGVFLGAFLANAMTGITLMAAVAVAAGNTLEAFSGAWLLARNGKFDTALQSLRGYLLLILAGGLGSIIAALNGATTLLLVGFLTSETYLINLARWWMGDVLGIVLISPMILVCWQAKKDRLEAKRLAEAALLLGLTFLAGQIIFLGWFHDNIGNLARGAWMFLLATWVALRLGSRGTAVAVLMMAVQALWGAHHGAGYFANDIAKTQLVNYWLYMFALSVNGMVLATFIVEHKRAETALQESEWRLRGIMNNASAVIFLKDADGRYLLVNAQYEKLFHISNAAIQGRTDHDIFPKDMADAFIEADEEVTRSGQPIEVEERVSQDDGIHTYISVKFPLRNISGEIYAVCGIATDITGRKADEQRLRDLSAHMLDVREEEKTRIAREIHDELGGTLAALKMDAYWLSRKLPENDETAVHIERIKSMAQRIDSAINTARRVITDLRPTMLDDLGLLPALEWQAEEFHKRTGIECRVNCIEDEANLDKQRSTALFRIFQEALANVSRHSGASKVEIEFLHNENEVMLTVSDNGCGIPENHLTRPSSYGMLGMTERAGQLGGKIIFNSPREGGFIVAVTLPLHAEKESIQ